MNFDVLIILGMGLFYLLRKISQQKQERARQLKLKQMAEVLGEGPTATAPAAGDVLLEERAPKPVSILASISAMIEAEVERQAELNQPPVPDTQLPDPRYESIEPDRRIPERVDTEFHAASESFADEWQTDTRSDWSDQESSFGFHSAVSGDPSNRPRPQAISEPEDDPFKDDPFKDDGARRHAPGLAELDHRRPTHRLRRMYQSNNKLAEAIILSEIIGPPVSRRTRSARRHLS